MAMAVIGGVTAAASLAGTAASAAGQARAGRTEETIGLENQRIANREADYLLKRGRLEERVFRREGKKALGGIRAAVGASGITQEGSPQEVKEESAANIALNALLIRHRSIKEAADLRQRGAMAAQEGRAARQAGAIGAAGTVLSGVAGIVEDYK